MRCPEPVGMRKGERWLLAAGFAVLFIVLNGYQFNNGDQEEHLPYVYKLVQPELYPADYLVPLQVEQFTVRFYFAHFVAFFMRWISPWPLVFGLYFVCLTVIAWSVAGLAALKSKQTIAPVLSVFILLLVNRLTTGGNGLIDVQLTCSVFAMVFGSFSVLQYESNTSSRWAVCCGISVLFQPLIGLQLFILLFLSRLWKIGRLRWVELIRPVIFFTFFSSPMLLPVFVKQFSAAAVGNETLYYDILFRFRNAHHYLPECFPISDYIRTILWWGAILMGTTFLWRRGGRDTVIPVMVIVAGGGLIYFIFFRMADIPAVGLSQWFKSTIWPGLMGVPVVAASMAESVRCDLKILRSHRLIFGGVMLILLGMFICSAMLPFERLKLRYRTSFYSDSDLGRMHHWIRENTPENAVVIPCPDDDSFLCEAGRSIPVGYKAIIHNRSFMLEWYERMKSVYGVEMLPGECRQEVLKRALIRYSAMADKEVKSPVPVDYRIMRKDMRLSPGWTQNLVHREGEYLLLKFEP